MPATYVDKDLSKFAHFPKDASPIPIPMEIQECFFEDSDMQLARYMLMEYLKVVHRRNAEGYKDADAQTERDWHIHFGGDIACYHACLYESQDTTPLFLVFERNTDERVRQNWVFRRIVRADDPLFDEIPTVPRPTMAAVDIPWQEEVGPTLQALLTPQSTASYRVEATFKPPILGVEGDDRAAMRVAALVQDGTVNACKRKYEISIWQGDAISTIITPFLPASSETELMLMIEFAAKRLYTVHDTKMMGIKLKDRTGLMGVQMFWTLCKEQEEKRARFVPSHNNDT